MERVPSQRVAATSPSLTKEEEKAPFEEAAGGTQYGHIRDTLPPAGHSMQWGQDKGNFCLSGPWDVPWALRPAARCFL